MNMANKLSHLDSKGRAKMVDVGGKPVTAREAVAEGFVEMNGETAKLISAGGMPKGDVLAVARVGAILAAKRCDQLIPLCHSLPLDGVDVSFEIPGKINSKRVRVRIEAVARVSAKTGVEMEALTAVGVAALTIYDMCKAVDKTMVIDGIRVLRKTGGTSGR